MTINAHTMRIIAAVKVALNSHVDATTRALTEAWATAWHEIADEWQAAIDDLIAAGDGQWPSRRQIERASRATNALKATLARLKALSTAAGVTITGSLDELAWATDDWERAIVGTQLPPGEAGAALTWSRVDARALDAIVQRATGQVESALYPLAADQQAAMKAVLIRGVAVGDNPRQAARHMLNRLHGSFNGGLARAERIARTEMLDAHRAASHAARQTNTDILAEWMWVCSRSARTCPACLAMDGRRFPLDQPGPHDHVCGRCTAAPVTKTWAELGFTDIPEPDDQPPSARDWFDTQPETVQAQIMGRERLTRLKAGRLAWDDIPVLTQNPAWRPSWGVRPLG